MSSEYRNQEEQQHHRNDERYYSRKSHIDQQYKYDRNYPSDPHEEVIIKTPVVIIIMRNNTIMKTIIPMKVKIHTPVKNQRNQLKLVFGAIPQP
ncbi:hypothetical protein C9374_003017 [Naegleria lovaniensis]|uniref:Uncharacterized protein n=1 Tax=Naegleria lovaniensis TaxID=51637 RepID=A0AA88KKK5_NAELO|nr:uncharacterized protein C9374_003017 [Naegleria lovaniensis]KAG2385868.1 hypothetical protein C9374_003017 [Naegleria lovaniensis]